MSNYYYLAAQLPLLAFERHTYINCAIFLEEARKWLSPCDFLILSGVNMNNFFSEKTDTSLLGQYKRLERALREDLVAIRKAEKNAGHILTPSIMEGNPREIEIKMLKLRWDFLCGAEFGHHFDPDFLISYFLKLQILERIFTFNKEKGREVFDQLCGVKL